MKYRVRNNKNIALLEEGELLKEVLNDRGISDPYHYLNLTDDDILDGMLAFTTPVITSVDGLWVATIK